MYCKSLSTIWHSCQVVPEPENSLEFECTRTSNPFKAESKMWNSWEGKKAKKNYSGGKKITQCSPGGINKAL